MMIGSKHGILGSYLLNSRSKEESKGSSQKNAADISKGKRHILNTADISKGNRQILRAADLSKGNRQIMNGTDISKGNRQILNAAPVQDNTKGSYPAQVIVRPFNLVSNTKAKEFLAQFSRPKERYKYQHNVFGGFDTAKVRDVVMPSSSFSVSGKSSSSEAENKTVSKSDIQLSSKSPLGLNKKVEGNGIVTEQNERTVFLSSNGKVVQDVCAGSVTVTNRAFKLIAPDKIVNVKSFPFDIKKTAVSLAVSSGGNKTVQVQSNGGSPPSVAQHSSNNAVPVQSSSAPASNRSPEQVSKSDPGGKGNLIQAGGSNKFQVITTAVVNGDTYFVCRFISDRPESEVKTTTTNNTAPPSAKALLQGEATSTNAAVTVANLLQSIAVTQVSQDSVEKCGTGGNSPVSVPRSIPLVNALNGQKATQECSESVKTVHLEILEGSSPEPKTLPTSSPPRADPTLKQSEDHLQKLLVLKKNSPLPVKLVSIKPMKGASQPVPLVLQPMQNVYGRSPQLQPVRISASGTPQNNVHEKQQTTMSAMEITSDALQQMSAVVHNTADGRQQTVFENPQVVQRHKGDPGVYKRRKEIALRYQREVERMRNEKKVEKKVVLPRRTVKLVETGTQTSLFSAIEPGRFVELSFTEGASGTSEKENTRTTTVPMGGENAEMEMDAVTSLSVGKEAQGANVDEPPAPKKRRLQSSSCSSEKENGRSDGDGTSSLHSNSAVHGDKRNNSKLELLYREFKECVLADESGNIPLHHAVLDGDVHEVKRQCLVLVGRKESLDWGNRDDETPLHLAVASGNAAITKMLLAFKASPSERDVEGNTALHLAVGPSSNLECLDAVLEHVEKHSELLNVFNDDGYSALHLSVINSKESEAARLISKGAEINIRDGKSGKTPLFHAVQAKHNSLARLLVRQGASTTVANFSGHTPLSICEMTMFPALEEEEAMDVDNPPPQNVPLQNVSLQNPLPQNPALQNSTPQNPPLQKVILVPRTQPGTTLYTTGAKMLHINIIPKTMGTR